MPNSFKEYLKSDEGRITAAEEHAMAHVGELIAQQMDSHGMNRTELATKLGLSQGRITQILDGDANLTLGTIARVLLAFDQLLDVSSRSISCPVKSAALAGSEYENVERCENVVGPGKWSEVTYMPFPKYDQSVTGRLGNFGPKLAV